MTTSVPILALGGAAVGLGGGAVYFHALRGSVARAVLERSTATLVRGFAIRATCLAIAGAALALVSPVSLVAGLIGFLAARAWVLHRARRTTWT